MSYAEACEVIFTTQHAAAQSTAGKPADLHNSEPRLTPWQMGKAILERKYAIDLQKVLQQLGRVDRGCEVQPLGANSTKMAHHQKPVEAGARGRVVCRDRGARPLEYQDPSLPQHPLTLFLLDTASLRRKFAPKRVC